MYHQAERDPGADVRSVKQRPGRRRNLQVRAAEDVATLDGTVRYIAGQLVDTITCDENGYGE
ncbi:MAG: hypothetical protein ACLUB3_01210 [Clostridium sp.]